jgi:hemoglobin/transferrin/lactoferrin receptor protein
MRVRCLPKLKPESKAVVPALIFAAGVSWSTVSLGQDEDAGQLDIVTVTATKIETSLHETPATVTVFSEEKVERWLVNDIKDLVRFEPGVSVRSSPPRFTAAGAPTGRDGNSGFNIRGMEGNRVLMLVDGVRVPDGYAFGAQSVGRGDYVDLDVLKSIEILRGPSSALYGSDGLAGAVSFITKDPENYLTDGRAWAARARVSYDSTNESFTQSLVGAGRAGDLSAMLAYSRREGHEQDTQGTNNSASINRTAPNPEDNKSNAVLLKTVYNLNESNRIRLTWDHLDSDTDWRVLSAVNAATASLIAFDDMERNRITLDHRYEGGGAIEQIDTAVYYQDSSTRQYSSEDRTTAPDRIRDATFDNAVRGVNVQLISGFATGSLQHRLVYGGDYSLTKQESLRTGTVPPAGETFPSHAFPTTEQTLAGAFVQDEITFANGRVSVYPALRWDFYKIDPENDPLFVAATATGQDDSEVSPKLAAVVRVTEELNFFVNAARGFKAPAPSQVNTGFTNPAQGYRSISNPDLKPETSETIEAGVRWSSERFDATLVGFDSHYDDFIDQSIVGGNFTPLNPTIYQYVNLNGADIYGAEASFQVRLGAGFKVNTAAAFARGDAKNNGVEAPLVTVDPVKVVSGVEWHEANDRFGAQLFATYSDSKAPSRAGQCSPTPCFLPDSFVVFDVVGWWKITDALTARAGVFNVSDEKYWWWSDVRGVLATSPFIDAYSQPGRSASVSVAMQF